ncbi:hypothetical protein ACWHLZ_44790 [Streptomyces chartreusis]
MALDELDEKRYTGSQATKKAARTALKPLEERLAELESQGYAELSECVTVEYLLAGGRQASRQP